MLKHAKIKYKGIVAYTSLNILLRNQTWYLYRVGPKSKLLILREYVNKTYRRNVNKYEQPLSWRVWVRYHAITGLNARPAGLQKPTTDIFQSKLCRLHI